MTTSLTGATISANGTSGTSYQWIDCSDNSQLTEETNTSFTATANGDYAVIIEENGCTDTSACVTITTVSIQENQHMKFELFLNPTTEIIQISANQQIHQVSIFNSTGKIIQSTNPYSSTRTIDLSQSSSGVYFVQLTSGDNTSIQKLFKL